MRLKLQLVWESATGRDLENAFNLSKHLSIFGIPKETECRFCGEQNETPIHHFSNCKWLHNLKELYLQTCEIAKEDLPNLEISLVKQFLKGIGLES